MQSIAIIILAVLAAVTYGILHDQITAHLCVEYFTIGHPQLFAFKTESPTLLAFGWGIAATWWVGLMLGIPLAYCSRAGKHRKISVNELYQPVGLLMIVAAIGALTSGMLGFALARNGIVHLIEPLSSQIPPSKQSLFIADLWAHTASYVVAFSGGIILIIYIRQSRLTRESQV